MRASVAALLLAACACSGGSSPTPSPEALSAAEVSKPAVEITYPAEGADPVPSDEVLVALTVRSFELVDAMAGRPKRGAGHVVYYLDVDPIPTGAGKSAIATGAGRAEASAKTNHTWMKVPPGRHTLGVQLVNNDDTPLQPPATDSVEVVVGE